MDEAEYRELIRHKYQRYLLSDLKLLTTNGKLVKSEKLGLGYRTVGISLSPAGEHLPYGGLRSFCAGASPGCSAGCLKFTGMNNMTTHGAGRIAKSLFYERHPDQFIWQVGRELDAHQLSVDRKGLDILKLACRVNVLSDLVRLANLLAEKHPRVQFSDYSAIRNARPGPTNLHRTYSRKETWKDEWVHTMVEASKNVSIVFYGGDLPDTWQGIPVINGDTHDARWLDPPGVIVGLKRKGNKTAQRAAIESGFAVRST